MLRVTLRLSARILLGLLQLGVLSSRESVKNWMTSELNLDQISRVRTRSKKKESRN